MNGLMHWMADQKSYLISSGHLVCSRVIGALMCMCTCTGADLELQKGGVVTHTREIDTEF